MSPAPAVRQRSAKATALLEWIKPSAVRRPSIPPLEAGLRPNSRLDQATTVIEGAEFEPDDVAQVGDAIWCTNANQLLSLGNAGECVVVAKFDGRCSALRADSGSDDGALVGVEGLGVVRVSSDGSVTSVCSDVLVGRCVTDLLRLDGSTVLVTIGSSVVSSSEWSRELVAQRRSGRLVLVRDGVATVAADGLAWPAGLAHDGDSDVVIALSIDHRVERRSIAALGQPGEALLTNLAGYPGRLRARTGGGWWLALPYLRNRATELLLSEPAAVADMAASVDPALWLVPMLRLENVYRDPLQIGQQRVMGVIKPWAPPRAYGLVVRIDAEGRVVESAHSRSDGNRKGVTGVTPCLVDGAPGITVACLGARAVVLLAETES